MMASFESYTLEKELLNENRISFDEKKLILAYQNLNQLPAHITEKYGSWVEVLDLSHNNINDLTFLTNFPNLTTLILDHNDLTSDNHFPGLPNVHTLWINNNHVTELGPFVARLSRSAPNLHFLSMMKNPATPCSFGAESYAHYTMYRYFAISYFEKLERLDDQNITEEEREEASKQIKNFKLLLGILPVTPKYPLDRENKIV